MGTVQSSALEPEYQAILTYAISQGYSIPGASGQQKENALLKGLKDLGVWNLIDRMYNNTTEGDADYACINWKNPGTGNLLRINSPAYTVNQGFAGNGSTSYLRTQFIPSVNGVNFTQNEAGVIVYTPTETAIAVDELYAVNNITIRVRGTADMVLVRINNSLTMSAPNNSSAGLYHTERTEDDVASCYKNGALILSGTELSSALSSIEFYYGCRNVSGTPTLFSTKTLGLLIISASLNGHESDISNLWTAYLS